VFVGFRTRRQESRDVRKIAFKFLFAEDALPKFPDRRDADNSVEIRHSAWGAEGEIVGAGDFFGFALKNTEVAGRNKRAGFAPSAINCCCCRSSGRDDDGRRPPRPAIIRVRRVGNCVCLVTPNPPRSPVFPAAEARPETAFNQPVQPAGIDLSSAR